jgi:hypothetical protein
MVYGVLLHGLSRTARPPTIVSKSDSFVRDNAGCEALAMARGKIRELSNS